MVLRAGANADFWAAPNLTANEQDLRQNWEMCSLPSWHAASLGELLLQVPCTGDLVAAAILVAATSCQR